ncbi:hypothetical protein ACFE04_018100 [Oxalis oulophora]
MIEFCKAQGFLCGIISEKGKPVNGASNNLYEWWKENVRFDRNAATTTTTIPPRHHHHHHHAHQTPEHFVAAVPHSLSSDTHTTTSQPHQVNHSCRFLFQRTNSIPPFSTQSSMSFPYGRSHCPLRRN